MRSIKFIFLSFLLLISCDIGEVPEKSLNNPLDTEAAAGKGINTPALVFFPDSASTSIGSTVSFEVFALGVDKLGMAYVKIDYDDTKLSVTSVNPGEFLQSSQNLFLYDTDTPGIINIYSSYLGTESVEVSGTGNLVYLVFQAKTPGVSSVIFSTESEFVDGEDNPIQIKGYGRGLVDAK